MTLGFRRNTGRHCSRCGKDLDDPASEERGVGPVCAAKDTTLYARTIPANFAGATAVILGVHAEALPEKVRERYEGMRVSLLEKSQKAARRNTDSGFLHLQGEDLRGIIRDIDWMLSFRMDEQIRRNLIRTVKFLGYNSLAGVLTQEASTSPAQVIFDPNDGRLYLRGKSCKGGFFAMRAIKGIIIPRRGSGEPYSAPASEAKHFLEAVEEFWPLYEGDLKEVASAAEQWHVTNAAKEALSVAKQGKPEALVSKLSLVGFDQGLWFRFRFPWLFEKKTEMFSIVEAIKNMVPGRDRKFDSNTKAWTVREVHKAKMIAILEKWYKIKEVE